MSADGLAGAPLDAAGLDAIETDAQQQYLLLPTKTLALVAEVRRLRAALEHYADADNWTAPPGHAWDELDKGYYIGEGPGYGVARAALGAPGAREETNE